MKKTVDFKSLLGDNALTVIDGGGRGGFHLLEELHSYTCLFSFEPDPDSYRKLEAEFTYRNSFLEAHFFELALASKDGVSVFHRNDHPEMNSLLAADPESFRKKVSHLKGSEDWVKSLNAVEEVKVKTIRLDHFVEQHRIQFIDLLKLDTQGSELDILSGAIETFHFQKIGVVVTEVLFMPLYKGQCFSEDVDEFMKQNGFLLAGLFLNGKFIERNAGQTCVELAPLNTVSADAVYYPDPIRITDETAFKRIGLVLALLGSADHSKKIWSNHSGLDAQQIDGVIRTVSRKSIKNKVKRFGKRWSKLSFRNKRGR